MNRLASLPTIVLLAIASLSYPIPASTEAAEQIKRLHEMVVPSVRPAGAPKRSDVCFSSRWKRPANDRDPHDSMQAAAAFHATRFVWVYTHDAAFIAKAKKLGYGFTCAVNSMVPDAPGGGRLKGRIQDLDGNLVSAPWMRSWKSNAWGCVNSPQWRKSYLTYARKSLDAGADGLQMDDPSCNYAAVNWGGCFCRYCIAGFRDYLQRNTTPAQRARLGIENLATFDYRSFLKDKNAPVGDAFGKWDGGPLKKRFVDFQQASVTAFYSYVRGEIDKYAGRPVSMSCNNYDGRWSFPYDLFDTGLAELPHRSAKPALLYEKFLAARKRGKAQIFTFVSSETDLTRKVIATAYACGGHLLVPWDVYRPSKPRYFGKPAEYADLYKFVRDNAALFDGYEDAAVVIPGREDPRFPTSPPLEIVDNANLAAFVRAGPKDAIAPIVIHLVDWGENPSAAKLRLHNERFFGQRKLQADLLRPGQEPQTLETEYETGRTVIVVPGAQPWSILLIRPR